MRENIGLFKAKRKDNCEWVEGFYFNFNARVFLENKPTTRLKHCIVLNDTAELYIEIEIDPETICEYTGLKDKNGKLIFERDKVKILYTDWMSKSDNDNRTLEEYLDSLCKIGTVEKNNFNGGWHLNFGDYYNNIYCGEHGYIEIIGNKFDNKVGE